MLWYGQYFLLPDKLSKRCVDDELPSRVVRGPACRVLSREMVSRCGPAPRVADDGKKLEISSDLVRDVHVAVVKWFAQGHIPLQVQRIPNGLASILRYMYEVKAGVTLVVPISAYCAANQRSQ